MINNSKKVSKREAIIIILVAAIVGLIVAGVVSYINYIDHKIEEPKYEILDVSSELVQNLFMSTRKNMDGNILAGTEYENIYYKKDIKISDIDEDFKMKLSYLKMKGIDFEHIDSEVRFKASNLKKSYAQIFGDTSNYKDRDIYYNCPSVIYYDSELEEYHYNDACGNVADTGFNNQLVEARRYEDYIAIYEKAVFYEIDYIGNVITYYRDIELTNKIDGLNYDFNDEGIATYKYVFRKADDGNYYFDSVSKEKRQFLE